MKKILFTLVAACFTALPLVAQNNVYYQKVPKLIPQADGSYRVNTDEFYFVPVSTPNTGLSTNTQTETPTEESNFSTIVTEQPVSMAVEKNKNLPGVKPYISIGASIMKSQANLDDDYAVSDTSIIKDTQPAFKLAFGERISPYMRVEVFYQYREKIADTYYRVNVNAKMQDIGANLFAYLNPKDTTRLFLGIGLAGTKAKLQAADFSANKWFMTPSYFLGIETPLNSKTDIDFTVFYSHTLVHRYDVQNIESYGLAVNLHFNFLEKTITYVK